MLLALLTCQTGGGDDHGHAHGPEGHSHAHGPEPVAHTVWTDKTELFVEYPPLVVGKTSSFAAHFTDLRDYGPVGSGKVTVSLVKDNKGIRHTVEEAQSPGIFRPALQPKEAGTYRLSFRIETPDMQDEIVVENVRVHESIAAAQAMAEHTHTDAMDVISFTKEQAWNMDFATAELRRDTIYDVIRAGGEIMPVRGGEKTVSATASGIVLFRKRNANIGSAVAKGELLFTISGGGNADHDLQAKFTKAKTVYTQARAVFERKQALFEAQAIGKPDLEAAQLAYELAKTDYDKLSSNYSKGGKSVFAPRKGYLKHLHTIEGQYVEAGDALAVIAENKTVTLHADVGQAQYDRLDDIYSATFAVNGRVYSLEKLNGRLISYGKTISKEHPKVPVYFEFANTVDLLPGSFVEVYLLLRPATQALVLPRSALLEEYGNYSVIVQTGGETFEQRNIKVGIDNGRTVQVFSGLQAGERVVTRGNYQVKMAALGESVPGHGHTH